LVLFKLTYLLTYKHRPILLGKLVLLLLKAVLWHCWSGWTACKNRPRKDLL